MIFLSQGSYAGINLILLEYYTLDFYTFSRHVFQIDIKTFIQRIIFIVLVSLYKYTYIIDFTVCGNC